MKIVTKLSEEDLSEGFTLHNDIFNHTDLSKRLTALFLGLNHGTVSLLDGQWGVGKTTYVRKWIADLKKQNIPAIYFDAFAADYIDSPFQAIASAFVKAAQEAERTSDPAYSDFLSMASKVGKAVAGTAAKIGVKIVTLGAIGATEIKQIEDLKDDISEALGEASESGVKSLLERHAKDEQTFASLRISLANLPKLLQPTSDDTPIKPLIVVIDELDRCRPDFALGILETLKHFFRADNLHFILVTNVDHLALSVAHRYGAGAGSKEYLEKFYDFVVHFDPHFGGRNDQSIRKFIEKIANDLLPAENPDRRRICDDMAEMAIVFQLSLRRIESVFTTITISCIASKDGEFRPVAMLCILSIIKSIRPELYKKAKNKSLEYPEICDFLSPYIFKNMDVDHILKLFRYYLQDEVDEQGEFKGFGETTWRYNLDRKSVISYITNSLIDRFGRI
jgi:KAP family P-loop domain